tara:strand:+ start:90 stop:407 length:318 start_codon:yes stop_codon:yes gene_type:complete
MEYNNRYNDVYTFTKQEDSNVLMEGKFEWMRAGGDFIDPSGGPFIKVGQMLSHIIYDDEFNVIVDGFERVETGYLIKCKEHKYDPNDKSHLADSKIIGGIINTTE